MSAVMGSKDTRSTTRPCGECGAFRVPSMFLRRCWERSRSESARIAPVQVTMEPSWRAPSLVISFGLMLSACHAAAPQEATVPKPGGQLAPPARRVSRISAGLVVVPLGLSECLGPRLTGQHAYVAGVQE